MERGLIHIYCGDGKGKTSSAVGLAVRAAGCKKKVLFARFLKNENSGELNILDSISDIEVLHLEKSYGFYKTLTEKEKKEVKKLYEALWNEVLRKVSGGSYDVLVMDEFMAAYRYGLIPNEEALCFLEKKPTVDPFDALEKYGADAIRWYFYVNSAPWLPNRFHGKAVVEGQRKFMGTLWNTYAFFVLYANIDQFDATKYELEYNKLSVMDKWLLSKMNTMVKTVDTNLGNYRIPEAARALQEFVDDMSNWYVRRSRERFWAKGMEQDKINAYMTLYTALVTVSKAAAPMIPFMTEEIYQNLVRSVDQNAPESIHLCMFPEVNEDQIDTELEQNMEHVLKLVVMGRACRNTSNIKNRQPIGQMFVKAAFDLPEFYQDIVADELNVKNVKFTDDVRDFTSYSFKPQLKTVGPKYGKMLGGIKAALDHADGNSAMDEINETGALKLDVSGQEITLFKEDLLIDTAQIEGYVSENDNGITVVLDTNLTPELLEEGFVREIISKVQTMRKEADFEVMDRIKVTYNGSEKAEKIFAEHSDEIGGEVLADKVVKAEPAGYVKEWKINGEAVTMGVEKQ